MDYEPIEKEIFHVHTHRCGHAGSDEDRAYVEKAIELGAKRIVFVDHTPFPEDPFWDRMKIEELPEYIASIHALKKEFEGQIEVLCSLEVEYFPQYEDYYRELKESGNFDLLVLGQHMYANPYGGYSYDMPDRTKEYLGLTKAIVDGINSGYFDVVAHPDRIFRRCTEFGMNQQLSAREIIRAAALSKKIIYLEKNLSSLEYENAYRTEFWQMADKLEEMIIYGVDAHSVKDMERRYRSIT